MTQTFCLLDRLFSDEVLDRLSRVRRPEASPYDVASLPIRRRHEVARATAPVPWRAGWAFKKAWAAYLSAAESSGLLVDDEVRACLAGEDDDLFRGAMAECLAAWFLVGLGFSVSAKPDGKNEKNSDLVARRDGAAIFVEVKAPHVPRRSNIWGGHDAPALRKVVEAAGSQLKKGRCNVVLIAPLLRIEVFANREQLVEAVIGQQVLRVVVPLEPEVEAPPPNPTFRQNGKLARLHVKEDGTTVTDLTRVSAVVCVEEVIETAADEEPVVGHRATIVHNPFAEVPLDSNVFGAHPQLVKRENGNMEWTDSCEDTS